ncbi:hypothetical protein ACV3ON_00140 [Clostridium perfringens]|uniref:hypothetical protein n=1 Tax=Clostridium perfringens TaxID=1502 RepID=UPI0037541FE7|nr:hypothetical protein [Clostridium perfringens]MDK0564388.1 hypothetical protein [Clostridium perfringens]MDK0829492.1 hypothetical protein [Clostridium perfringens]MDK0865808.1 hypothetical protein [Clostridium perfringens]MDK0867825.1 hypothetical protein [Clostridium perfringens]
MINYKKENSKLLIDLVILILCIIIVIGSFSWIYFSDGYFREWIGLISSLIGSLIGGIITMVGVVLTLNRAIDSEEEQKKEKIKKLKIILRFEIENFVNSFEKEILRYIEKRNIVINENLEQLRTRYDLNFHQEEIYCENIYKIDTQCKEYIYELMLLDNNFKSDELIEFYKLYSILEKKLPTINSNIRDIKESILKFLASDYSKMINHVHYLAFDDRENMVMGLALIEGNKEKINKSLDVLNKEFNNGINHKSDLIYKILEYLRED